MPRILGFEQKNRIQKHIPIESELLNCINSNLLDLNDICNVALEKFLNNCFDPKNSIIVLPRIMDKKLQNRSPARPYIEDEILHDLKFRLLDLNNTLNIALELYLLSRNDLPPTTVNY